MQVRVKSQKSVKSKESLQAKYRSEFDDKYIEGDRENNKIIKEVQMAVLVAGRTVPARRQGLVWVKTSRAHVQNITRGNTVLRVPTLGARLAEEDLSGLDLSGIKFHKAGLDGALFIRSTLDRAGFVGAYLGRADLSFCNGKNASFMDADVTGARFNNAFLRGADFRGIKGIPYLAGADLAEAMVPGKLHDMLKYGGYGTGIINFDRIIWAREV